MFSSSNMLLNLHSFDVFTVNTLVSLNILFYTVGTVEWNVKVNVSTVIFRSNPGLPFMWATGSWGVTSVAGDRWPIYTLQRKHYGLFMKITSFPLPGCCCNDFPCLWVAHDKTVRCGAVECYWLFGQRENSGTLSRTSRRTACCYTASWNRNKGVSPSADWTTL